MVTKREVLEGHYEPPGVPFFDPEVCAELEKEGLLMLPGSVHVPFFSITEAGRDVVRIIRGEISRSNYALPNWVLAELTASDGGN